MLEASTDGDVSEVVPLSPFGAARSASPALALTVARGALAFLPLAACWDCAVCCASETQRQSSASPPNVRAWARATCTGVWQVRVLCLGMDDGIGSRGLPLCKLGTG